MNRHPAPYLLASCLAIAAFSPRAQGDEDPYAQFIPKTPPLSAAEERLKLKVPPGFEVELVASEPEIKKPLNIAFDDRGRLWMTESVEYPFPAKEGTEPRDCVRILEDADGDGRAEKVTPFACGLNIPLGVIPVPGGAIVYGIPKIWKLIDHDGDDRADERKELYGGFGYGDTHGMVNSFTWGLDGWVHACHGYSNSSDIRGADGSRIRLHSGNTFRFRTDGSSVEQFTHGQVNPFGLAMDPLGNLYTADCHSQPVYMLLRHGWYPSFGKPDAGLGFGPVMIDHDHGGTGISGVAYYAAAQFPADYKDTVFTGNVITNRVDHDGLERRGSTLWAVHRGDFVASEDPWFRPVDLKVAPDGSLYIADFYNRIIGHYEVPLTHPGRDRERGRIWRVVHRGGGDDASRRPQSAHLARGRRAGASPAELIPELVTDLASLSLTVRIHAANVLVELGGPAAEAVQRAVASPANAYQRAHGLWVLERLVSLDAPALEEAARSPDPLVRTHAQRILESRDAITAAGRALAIDGLKDPDAFVRRAAAEVLGKHAAPENLPPLLALRRAVPPEDTHLLYAVRIALRDQLSLAETWEAAAKLDPAGSEAQAIADVARGASSPEAARFLIGFLKAREVPDGELASYLRPIARYIPEAHRDPALRAAVEREGGKSVWRRLAAMEALLEGLQERGAPVEGWAREEAARLAAALLEAGDDGKTSAGIRLARSLKLRRMEETIAGVARSRKRPEDLRKSACDALVAIDAEAQVPLLGRILGDPEEAFAIRQHAAGILGDIDHPSAVEELALRLRAAPERVGVRIAASLAKRPASAKRLLSEVESGKASARLLQEREVRVRFSRSGIPGIDARLESLTEGLPSAEERSLELLRARLRGFSRATPDAGRGSAVYEKICAPCHKAGGKGTKIGPDLDGIGTRGLERLLEDILDPSRNVDQAFRSTVIVQNDGLARSGLLLREEGELLVMVDSQGKTFNIPKGEVKTREVSGLSPMPSNIAEALPEGEFHDLMAFLLGLR